MNGERVLVTGGSGSLGSALLARAAAEGWAGMVTVLSRDEAKQAALRERHPEVRYMLGDVRDQQALARAMRGQDVVVHAAAYKRVPEAERETMACVGANVEGSMNVVREALRAGVPRVLGISTDKACAPINAYGASKALMERLFQSVRQGGGSDGQAFTLVRYGNVLASRGSVVPAMRERLERGEPVQLTDPGMTRFWLTLEDAVDLVLAALELADGQVLIPRCPASSMASLARAVAPGAQVVVVGQRAGEKRHEQLLNAHEAPYACEHPMGYVLEPMAGPPPGRYPAGHEYRSDTARQLSWDELAEVVARLDAGEPARLLR